MNRNIIYALSIGSVLLFTLPSCFVAKEYQRPQVVDESLYRTDQLPSDSITLADLSWEELFTDSHLAAYIREGLDNNIDIRVALQNIVSAEAYYKQSQAGRLPVIGATAQATHQELAKNSQMGSVFSGGVNQFELSGNLSWEADIWGRIK